MSKRVGGFFLFFFYSTVDYCPTLAHAAPPLKLVDDS